jgi:hypothetical protein
MDIIDTIKAWFRRDRPNPEIDVRDVEPLGQDEYAELLEADRARVPHFSGSSMGAFGWIHKPCSRPGVLVEIAHPIWDGPFHGAGSGRVDVRQVLLCPTCDAVDAAKRQSLGLYPVPSELAPAAVAKALQLGRAQGRPIRLPWLDRLPVKLRRELYERPAFHNLMVKVELAGPPPPPPPRHAFAPANPSDPADPANVIGGCDVCGHPREDSRHRNAR